MRNRLRANFQHLVNRLGWLYLGLITVWFGLRLVFFDQLWWLALLNTAAFYLFVPLALLLPVSIWLRQRHLMIGLAIPIAIVVGLFSQVILPPFSRPELVPQSAFTVMSFNILWDNQNYAQIAQAIHRTNPDIVGLQEVLPANKAALTKALSDYPYSAFHQSDEDHTVGIVSRFPIVSMVALPDPPVERGLQLVIDVNGKLLTAIVVHLAPNNMPLFPLGEFVKQTRDRYTRRADEVELLKQMLQNRSHPTVVACDCNMTDTSQTYAQLQGVLSDSFREAGWGLGHTLTVKSVPFPIQRVDYLWHTADLQSVNAYVGSDGGSDHRPMIAKMQFVQN
ncbi:endonuclease/exonuclease/phosphatase family protein [Nodosilinea nodulosa]|uniref:endonuclease/exonuclease/phosphatase family protein n=1 Tax=Nodosilinea nodulosa TaxID=416001 RepID=UPI0002E7A655|nr:endonuclease/exonuclease/phosphatase family protein [Nodosilinea nodulosa]